VRLRPEDFEVFAVAAALFVSLQDAKFILRLGATVASCNRWLHLKGSLLRPVCKCDVLKGKDFIPIFIYYEESI